MVLAALGCAMAVAAALLPLRAALVTVLALLGALMWLGEAWQGTLGAGRPLLAVCAFLGVLVVRRLVQDRRRAEVVLRAERATRAAAAEVAAIQERERIARDLHDGLTHLVTGQLIVLRTARAALADGEPGQAEQRLDAAIELARRILDEARDVVDVLKGSPPGLSSLRDAAREWADVTDHDVELELPELNPALDGAQWGALVTTLREALTNVARHSTASSVRVEMRTSDTRVRLLVSDPGPRRARGDPSMVGHGMQGLRERAAMLRGQLRAGPVGEGWHVELELPLASAELS